MLKIAHDRWHRELLAERINKMNILGTIYFPNDIGYFQILLSEGYKTEALMYEFQKFLSLNNFIPVQRYL